MTTYFVLGKYTDQGIRNIKKSPDRVEAAQDLAQSLGVDLRGFFLTVGSYDMIIRLEADADASVVKFLLALASQGNITTDTLRAFPESEFREIVAELP